MPTDRDNQLNPERRVPEQLELPDQDLALTEADLDQSAALEADLAQTADQAQSFKNFLTSISVLLALLPAWALAAWLLLVLGDFLGMVDRYYADTMRYWQHYAIGLGLALLLPAALVGLADRRFKPGKRLLEAGRAALLSFFSFSLLFLILFGGLRLMNQSLPLFVAPILLAGFTPLLCFIALTLGHYWASQIFSLPAQNTSPPLAIRIFSLISLAAIAASLALMLLYGGTPEMNTSAAWIAISYAAQALTLACLIWLLAYRGQVAWRLGFLLLTCWMIYADAAIYALWPQSLAILRAFRDLCLLGATLCLYLPTSRRWLLA